MEKQSMQKKDINKVSKKEGWGISGQGGEFAPAGRGVLPRKKKTIPRAITQQSKAIQSKGKHSTAISLERNCSRENEKNIILIKVEGLQNRAQGHQNQGQEASKSSLEAPKSTPKSLLGALGALLGASWALPWISPP